MVVLIRTRSIRPLDKTSSICLSIYEDSHLFSLKHVCMTSWSMLPQTRAGVKSVEERTKPERRGFRKHCEAVDTAVIVMRRSG